METSSIAVARQAARLFRDALDRPLPAMDDPEDVDQQEGTIFVEPLDEESLDAEGQPALFPSEGTLDTSLARLADKRCRIWAVDGGILTWRVGGSTLIIGRAVVARTEFGGYGTVHRAFDIPLVPFVFYPQLPSDRPDDLESTVTAYLRHALGRLPVPTPGTRTQSETDAFADGAAWLSSLPPEIQAASATERDRLTRALDLVRNAAETVAFLYALNQAQRGDYVLRDGRLHGSAGFLTHLVSQKGNPQPEGDSLVRDLIGRIEQAVRKDVRVLGVIKHPRSSFCVDWYRRHGHPQSRFVATDSHLYFRRTEARPGVSLRSVGVRSSLWQIQERLKRELPPNLSHRRGRELVHWFYEHVGSFFLKTRLGALPIRFDFVTYNNHYRAWLADELVEDMYTLCRGSGSALGLPQPIVAADSYAKVHRVELDRSIREMLRALESSQDENDQQLAREFSGYLDVYYRGTVTI